MVFVSRASPSNIDPFTICVYTDEASTCVETVGCFFSFFVPGRVLVELLVQPVIASPVQIDTVASTTSYGNTTVTNEVQEIVPSQPLLPFPSLIVVIELEGGERCYHHERNRWRGRRVTNILITDYFYNIGRTRDDDYW